MANAVILAGGKSKFANNKSKATLEFNGKRYIDCVIGALDKSENIEKILIMGDRNDLGKDVKGHRVIQERRDFFQNIVTGYDHLELLIEEGEPLFYVYSDAPFINPGGIDDFLEKCNKHKFLSGNYADLSICLVDIEEIRKRFPGYKDNYPYTRLNDFGARFGNCFLLNVGKILDSEFEKKYHIFENAYNARRFDEVRSTIRFIRNAGSLLIYDLAPKTLDKKYFYKGILKKELYVNTTLEEIEHILFRKTKLKIKIFKSNYPELAVDVDTKRDKNYIEDYTKKL